MILNIYKTPFNFTVTVKNKHQISNFNIYQNLKTTINQHETCGFTSENSIDNMIWSI